jgi:hypothetical protein
MLGQSGHGKRGRRSGVDMKHPVTRDYFNDVRIDGVDPTGVDVGADAPDRHGSGQLVDVDVHASSIARPRLEEGRSVHGEKGDAVDHTVTSM